MRETILDAAERRARNGGYNGFSFRDLANDVGIKSASVHYYFPTKEDLGEVLAQRYLERISDRLGSPTNLSARTAVRRLGDIFIEANETDNQMCLCGVLAAESGNLPPRVAAKASAFFKFMHNWLEKALRSADEAPRPEEIVAALEGGLLTARITRDPAILRSVVSATVKRVRPQ